MEDGGGGVSVEEKCSARQLRVAVFVALLAPVSTLPGLLAKGGTLGWLAPAAAAPVILLVVWRIGKLGGDGLAGVLKNRWGWLGRGLLALYYLWALALSALTAGNCVDRLSRTDYLDTPDWVLALALAAVSAYLIYRGPGAFLRALEIFFLALVVVLALFFLLGAANLSWENLRPGGWEQELRGVLGGIVPTAATAAAGTLAAFLPHGVGQRGEGRGWHWAVGWCVVAGLLGLLVLGSLGAPLAAKAPLPFFLTLQGLGLPGGLQRLEALGTAAWALSDVALLGLAALTARIIGGDRPWMAAPALMAAFLGGCLLPNAQVVGLTGVLFGANLVLGMALPVLLSLTPERDGRG